MNHKRPLPSFPEKPKRWPGRKDTKRWCRGVVGREHKPEWRPLWGGTRFQVQLCVVCGKHLHYSWEGEKS